MKHFPALLLAAFATSAFADTPLRQPEKLTVCSSTKNLCAFSDPTSDTTVVSPADGSTWVIPGWHRWLFVSDDRESVVVGYNGMNLVPVDVTLKEPVLFFYNRGTLVRTVTLGDLYKNKSQLRRTVSHYAWAHVVGLNKSNQLVVELVNGKKVAFAANTGAEQPPDPHGT